jgi:hypothetical protein
MIEKKLRRAKICKMVLIILIIFVVANIILAFYLAYKTKWIIDTVNAQYRDVWNEETAKKLSGIVTEELANEINFRDGFGYTYREEKWDSYEEWRDSWYESLNEYKITFVFIFFDKAVVYYRYSYVMRSTSDHSNLSGAVDIPCTITFKLKNFKWVVVSRYEEP